MKGRQHHVTGVAPEHHRAVDHVELERVNVLLVLGVPRLAVGHAVRRTSSQNALAYCLRSSASSGSRSACPVQPRNDLQFAGWDARPRSGQADGCAMGTRFSPLRRNTSR